MEFPMEPEEESTMELRWLDWAKQIQAIAQTGLA